MVKVYILYRSGLVKGVVPDDPEAEGEMLRCLVEKHGPTECWSRELWVLRRKGEFVRTQVKRAVLDMLEEMGLEEEEVEIGVS